MEGRGCWRDNVSSSDWRAWSTRSSTSRPTARPTTVCRPTLDTRREIRTPFISARSQLTHRASAIGCQATARKRLRSEGRRELPCLGSCAIVVRCSPFSCESAIDQRFLDLNQWFHCMLGVYFSHVFVPSPRRSMKRRFNLE